jgi:hypothetical protein
MRIIRKGSTTSARETTDFLSSIFVRELINPSSCLWIVSPWITDIPLIDNRFGSFPFLDFLGRKRITMSQVLIELVRRDSQIVVGTRVDPKNFRFLESLRKHQTEFDNRIVLFEQDESERLHDKAMCGDDFLISGSMNFTFAGAILNQENIRLDTDPQIISETRIDLSERFGGDLNRGRK